MNQRWVKWTVIVLAVVLAFGLALSVVPADAAVRRPPANGTADYQLGAALQTQPDSLRWWMRQHP